VFEDIESRLEISIHNAHVLEPLRWVWQVILAHLWQLTPAHLWQLAGQGRGMEMRCALGWSVAKARSTARASISPWSWSCLSRQCA
jgi:hypothetical protein